MRFLKTNNSNWRKLCKGEVQAKQLEIYIKENKRTMNEKDQGKKVKIMSVDSEDEKHGIQVGDLGEIDSVISGVMVMVLMTTGIGKGVLFPMDESQLELI